MKISYEHAKGFKNAWFITLYCLGIMYALYEKEFKQTLSAEELQELPLLLIPVIFSIFFLKKFVYNHPDNPRHKRKKTNDWRDYFLS